MVDLHSDEPPPGLQKSRAYDQLLLDIILCELKPGRRLEEQALAVHYGVGLAGIRDALGRLALEGLVVRRPRVGTSVALLDLVDLREAQEARLLLEPRCAVLAAARASDGERRVIAGAFDGAEAAARAEDFRALVAMDQAFHCAISHASGNATLAGIVMTLHHKAARHWVYVMANDASLDERLADVAAHQALGEAIATGEAQAASALMTRLLSASAGAGERAQGSARIVPAGGSRIAEARPGR